MQIKEGVKLNGLRPEMLLVVIIANEVYKTFDVEFVITEATGGKHGTASLHYVGLAIDTRTRDFLDGDIKLVAQALRKALGENYDVVIESTHIHIEFQPK